MGGRAAGIGYATSTLTDEWAVTNNIGGLAHIEKLTFGFAFEALPVLPGSDRMNALAALPVAHGAAGISFFKFGNDLYNEHIISAGYSNSFGNTSLGIRTNYVQYRAEGFGTRGYLTIDFGGVTKLSEQVFLGAFIKNINQPKISDIDDERVPVQMIFGIRYQPARHINIMAEVDKTLSFDLTWRGGLEIYVYKKICFRTGFNLHPNAAFFGTGYQSQKLKIDYAIQFLDLLSTGHQISASYMINLKPKND